MAYSLSCARYTGKSNAKFVAEDALADTFTEPGANTFLEPGTTFCVGFPSCIVRISNLTGTFSVFLLWKNISILDAYIPPSSFINIDSATGSIQLTVETVVDEVSVNTLLSATSTVEIVGTLVDVIVFCLLSNKPDA